jgi:hypothetical protein
MSATPSPQTITVEEIVRAEITTLAVKICYHHCTVPRLAPTKEKPQDSTSITPLIRDKTGSASAQDATPV